MSSDLEQQILARLHLEAVLGVIPEFFHRDPAARALLPKNSFSLRLATTDGEAQTLTFTSKGAFTAVSNDLPSTLTLFFLGNRQLNRLFLRDGIAVPLPFGNPFLLPKLFFFSQTMGLLEKRLKSIEQPEGSPLETLDLWLQFLVALFGLNAVGRNDPKASPFLKRCPPGLAEFSVAGTDLIASVEWNGNRVSAKTGKPERHPDARIIFSSPAVLEQALRQKLDQMAALSLGLIRTEGLLPLAEGLGIVSERVSHYLQPQ